MSRPDEPGEDLAEFDRIVELLRQRDPDDRLEQPPASVWDAIAGELGLDGATGGGSPSDQGAAPGGAVAPPSGGETGRPPATVTPIRRFGILLAAAAAVIVVVGAPAAYLLLADGEPDPEVVASVELETLAGAGTGSAQLEVRDGGHRLALDVTGLEPVDDGHYEVWLLTPEVDDMISLGPLADDGTYVIPDSIDVERFSVVDISAEPADGDPTHSGDSRLRGQLDV